MRVRDRAGSLGESLAGISHSCWFRDGNVYICSLSNISYIRMTSALAVKFQEIALLDACRKKRNIPLF